MRHGRWMLALVLASGMIALGGVGVRTAGAGSIVGESMPRLEGGPWINHAPLTAQDLRGRVVLVVFWTYGCYNCRHVEPYIKAWHRRFRAEGLVVVGVHSPEFAYEREPARVRDYMRGHDIAYPVVLDNDFAIWKRFGNRYWPTLYLIDRRGIVRYRHIGEGGYARTERHLRGLLAAGGQPNR